MRRTLVRTAFTLADQRIEEMRGPRRNERKFIKLRPGLNDARQALICIRNEFLTSVTKYQAHARLAAFSRGFNKFTRWITLKRVNDEAGEKKG